MRSNRYSLGTKKFEGHSGFHHLIYRKIQTFPDSFWHRPSSLESMLFLTLSYLMPSPQFFLWRSKNNLGSLSTKKLRSRCCLWMSVSSGCVMLSPTSPNPHVFQMKPLAVVVRKGTPKCTWDLPPSPVMRVR